MYSVPPPEIRRPHFYYQNLRKPTGFVDAAVDLFFSLRVYLTYPVFFPHASVLFFGLDLPLRLFYLSLIILYIFLSNYSYLDHEYGFYIPEGSKKHIDFLCGILYQKIHGIKDLHFM